jgi:germination protein M
MTQNSLKIALAALWALVVIILGVVGLKLLNELVLVPRRASGPLPTLSSSRPRQREIKVYFADKDAVRLAPERRFAEVGAGPAADAKAIMEELIKGPLSAELYPTIPTDTRLLNAYAIGDMIVLDFTHELQTNHAGGSTGELLTVYSIVNTITQNLEGIRRIQMLVEGEEIESLAGHLDLTKPLSPNTERLAA